MNTFRRLLASIACMMVGAASFALSYVALRDEAIRVQAVPEFLAWLIPVVIDGGVICGSAVIWSYGNSGQTTTENFKKAFFPFAFVGSLVVVSVIVNMAHAGPEPLAKAIAALPPLILLGTLELVTMQGAKSKKLSTTDIKTTAESIEPVAHIPIGPSASKTSSTLPFSVAENKTAPSSLSEPLKQPIIPSEPAKKDKADFAPAPIKAKAPVKRAPRKAVSKVIPTVEKSPASSLQSTSSTVSATSFDALDDLDREFTEAFPEASLPKKPGRPMKKTVRVSASEPESFV